MSDVTTGSLFNPQFFMNPPWWLGRVEEKETWSDNIAGETFTNVADIKGWGHRYKVRIFNWHTGDLAELPPKDMAFCQVVMPVTAGSGHGGAAITPSIESGSVVFGFFMDGMAGQEGYIMGVLGNSNNNVPKERGKPATNQPQTSVTSVPAGSPPETRPTVTQSQPSIPPTGPGSLSNNLQNIPDDTISQLSTQQLIKLLDPSQTPSLEVFKAASKARQKARAKGLPAAEVERLALVATVLSKKRLGATASAGTGANCNQGYQQFGDTYTDGDPMRAAKVPDDRIVGNVPLFLTEAFHIETLAKITQDKDAKKKIPLLDVCKKDKSETKGIQRVIQNLLNDIEELKKQFNQVSAFASEVSAYSTLIQEKVLGAIDEISGYLKNTLTAARGYVLDYLNKQVEKIANQLFPTEIPDLYKKVEGGTNLINCLFNNLIGGLKGLLANLLTGILDQLINAPLCAVENFLSGFLDTILGPITSTIQSVLAPINALIGGVTGALGSLSGIFDFIAGITQFFSCDEEPDCIEYKEISQAGPALPTFDLSLGLPSGGALADFADAAPECPTGPAVCGPPFVQIFGGGTNAIANAIVSPISSSIIGFDIINPGAGFLTKPSAAIIDTCGTGSGASLEVNLEDETPDNSIGTTVSVGIGTTVLDICEISKNVFEQSLQKELTIPKKIKNITILSPGNGYLSAPNGSLGGGGRLWKEPDEGYVKTKCGGYFVVQPYKPIRVEPGDTYYPPDGLPRIITEEEIIDLPLLPIKSPQAESLTYPVILCIEEIKVLDKGFGYRPGDKLIITPDNGTIVDLIINENGEIDEVKIIKGGCGFNDLPSIKTNSPTGFNATFSTIFKPTRLDEFDGEIPENVEIISVVDCVGRIY